MNTLRLRKMKKTALINGVTGQDGAYLAKHLLGLGYQVVGLSRKLTQHNIQNLILLNIANMIEVVDLNPHNLGSMIETIKRFSPSEIYDLSGQSSVANSFLFPEETRYSIVNATENWLEAIVATGQDIRFFNSSSSDCFGFTPKPANETTKFNPLSPYAEAKARSFSLVEAYRNDFGLSCYNGVMFNHESPLRPPTYFSKKVINGAHQIARGEIDRLPLGNLNFSRDWGWAPEYVEAMHLIMQAVPDNYVIASGLTISAADFLEYAFRKYQLDWKNYCIEEKILLRPFDISMSMADPSKIYSQLNWKAKTDAYGVIDKMTAHMGHAGVF